MQGVNMKAEVEVRCVLTGGSNQAGSISVWSLEAIEAADDLIMVDSNDVALIELLYTTCNVGGQAVIYDSNEQYEGAWLLDEDGYTVRWFQHGALMSATWEWDRG
jgi:hypothetical protein